LLPEAGLRAELVRGRGGAKEEAQEEAKERCQSERTKREAKERGMNRSLSSFETHDEDGARSVLW
jgi:hypothetical protein